MHGVEICKNFTLFCHYADKVIEVALIVLLLIEGWQMRRQARG